MNLKTMAVTCALLVLAPVLLAADSGAPASIGWRGNQTGLFPDAKVPVEWSIVSTGPMEGMKCAAEVPADRSDKAAAPVEGGLVTTWLGIGPFVLEDSTKDFDKEQIPGEAQLSPRAGVKVGDLEWKPVKPVSDMVSFWHVDAAVTKGEPKVAGYACTCLYAAKAGKVRAVIEHVVGAKIFVNGRQVYSDPAQRCAMGSAYALSSNRIASNYPAAPSFEFDVVKGWNRMTVKLVAPNQAGWNPLQFCMRLTDAPGTPYERKNIAWETALPDQSNATPIVVGDKVFLMAEPDELFCIDKATGKVLWSATNNWYDATPQAERDANPAFKEKVEPIAKELREWKDPVQRWNLRKKLQNALIEADKKKFTADWDGHYAAHFEIVGYTTCPVSDGKRVYVWTGAGVAACYELDGRRVWIRRIEGKLFYSAGPAVIGGKLAVFFQGLYGLDAKTGEIAWKQPEVKGSIAALLSARIAGVDVFFTQPGDAIRASDGHVLWKNPAVTAQSSGGPWAPGVVLGDVMATHWYGMQWLFTADFRGCAGDAWQPKVDTINSVGAGFPALPKAPMDIERWTAGSPLIHDGLMYGIDWCGGYCVVDLKTKKTLAYRELGLKGDVNYVAMPVAASCTLVGRNIVVMDNQGHSVVLEPGGACKEVARNRIATQIQRDWASTAQEYVSYCPPVVDGNRMFIRGERHLYCIGGK